MLSIGKLAAGPGAGRYYVDQVARGAEDYYAAEGGAPGYWLGTGAEELGLRGEVREAGIVRLLEDADPASGEPLRQPSLRGAVAGFDLTFRGGSLLSQRRAGIPEPRSRADQRRRGDGAHAREQPGRPTCPRRGASAMTGLTRAALMTAREVAELLDVPVSTVLEWGRKATLPRAKLGRHVRFIRAHVKAAILAAERGNGIDRDADWSAQLVRPELENGARRP